MSSLAHELARRLGQQAEAVCRYYLPKGRRHGRYWLVGDVEGTPGQSLYVRLSGPETGPGAAGKWTDAATGGHGDLLDLIGANRDLSRLHDVLAEARAFLRIPKGDFVPIAHRSAEEVLGAAQRLFVMSGSLDGTLAEHYLVGRGISLPAQLAALRFHPRCYYRPKGGPTQTWPALIAAVTDLTGKVTGMHRTWLDPAGAGKAPIETPRRALGHLLGHAVRFGQPDDVLAAGEGLETVLSLREILPSLPLAAALSANHLAALQLPAGLRILYILQDPDAAGAAAVARLRKAAKVRGIVTRPLRSIRGDFNDDLCAIGAPALLKHLLPQLEPGHGERFRSP